MNESSLIISLRNSILSDIPLPIPKEQEKNYAIILGLSAQLIWAFVTLQLKSFYILFPIYFSNSSVAFWRSFAIFFLGYFFARKNNIEITPISKIHNKMWFFCRNIGIFIALILWVSMNKYLRISTCQCINSCHPIIVLFLAIIILKEKFYVRYIAGILFCLFGASIIILNERTSSSQGSFENNDNIAIGIGIGIVQLLVFSASAFAQKFLCNENMSGEVQNIYLAIFHSIMGLFIMIVTNHYGMNLIYILFCFLNGILVYSGNYLMVECLKLMPISKYLPISYMGTVFVFILGTCVLGEAIYVTDILGSALIISFQLYNAWVPIQNDI